MNGNHKEKPNVPSDGLSMFLSVSQREAGFLRTLSHIAA
jgi:hypothetical protein